MSRATLTHACGDSEQRGPEDVVNIGFIGLGKLGLPVALAIGGRGHGVYAHDANPAVLEDIRDGRLRTPEPGAEELLELGRLHLVTPGAIVDAAELVFVAVQTPHEPRLDGSKRLPPDRRDFDYSYLRSAVGAVAVAARSQGKQVTLAVISTVLPGTMEREIMPLVPANVALAYNPLFTAAGTTIEDYLHPELVLLGVDDDGHSNGVEAQLRQFYSTVHDSPVFATDVRTASSSRSPTTRSSGRRSCSPTR
jgi:UDPglucose 6-dehydrogenase